MDIKCPYCGYEYEYDGDPFGQDDQWEEECPECDKFFMVTGRGVSKTVCTFEEAGLAPSKKKHTLPLEKQICTQEQAEKLAGLLGDDAPGSIWYWVFGKWGYESNPKWELSLGKPENPLTKCFPAYTGDELGVLLTPYFDVLEINADANVKASLAITGLTEGWIKKENFRYEEEQ